MPKLIYHYYLFAGKPMFAAFADEFLVSVCVLLFLLVFFCPGDAFHAFVKLQPVYLAVCFVKEVYRCSSSSNKGQQQQQLQELQKH